MPIILKLDLISIICLNYSAILTKSMNNKNIELAQLIYDFEGNIEKAEVIFKFRNQLTDK